MVSSAEEPIVTNLRILIVEDDARIVSFLKRGLEGEGHVVDVASDKTHSLSLTQTKSYEIILLDIFLGEDNGLEICRELREQAINTPILVMTAKDSTETKRASYQAGAGAYLQKPFSFEELIVTIKKLSNFGPFSESLP